MESKLFARFNSLREALREEIWEGIDPVNPFVQQSDNLLNLVRLNKSAGIVLYREFELRSNVVMPVSAPNDGDIVPRSERKNNLVTSPFVPQVTPDQPTAPAPHGNEVAVRPLQFQPETGFDGQFVIPSVNSQSAFASDS